MEKVKKTWMALVLGALLMGVLAGAVWARPKAGPVEHGTASKLDRPRAEPKAHGTASKLDKPKSHHAGYHYTLTIPGAAFHPREDGYDWFNNGNYIEMDSGQAIFSAGVPMLPGNRTVESMTMYVMDHSGLNACVSLFRTKTDGTETNMASVCSTGSSINIRSFSDTTVSPDKIWGGHGAYLWLEIYSPSIEVYAVQIKYY